MRIANAEHEAQPWRIREITQGFTLEDVWALPAHGGAEDFGVLLECFISLDPTSSDSLPTRVLWRIRDLLGAVFAIGRVSGPAGAREESPPELPIPGTAERSLAGRLAHDLRDTLAEGSSPRLFSPLYRTDREYAAELSNKTVHGVIHLAWVEQDVGRYQGQMAVYVKPRGALGKGYMALIRPFRHLIVYPALMRQIEQAWDARRAA